MYFICKCYSVNFQIVIVATYPSAGRRRGARGCVFQERKMRGVATNVYSRKTSEKPKKAWSTKFKCERFGSCIYARGWYQHPMRPSQGTTAFNQVCKHDFKMFSLFYVFWCFMLFIFLCFCGRQWCVPCSYVFLNCDKEIRPTQFFEN